MRKVVYIVTVFLFKFSLAQETIVIKKGQELIDIAPRLEIFKDTSGKLNVNDIRKKGIHFKKTTSKTPNLGISAATYWVRFKIRNESGPEKFIFFAHHYPLDEVTFYEIKADNQIDSTRLYYEQPIYSRKYHELSYAFDIDIPKKNERLFYLKLRSDSQIFLPLKLATPEQFFNIFTNKNIFFGIYYGIIIAMLLYNLVLFIVIKDKVYFFYVGYLLSIGLAMASNEGHAIKFLWNNSVFMVRNAIVLFFGLSCIFALAFAGSLLKVRQYAPKINTVIKLFVLLYSISILLSFAGYPHVGVEIINFMTIFFAVFFLVIGFVAHKHGIKSAKFFLMAWSTYLVFVLIYTMKNYEIIPFSQFTNSTLLIGSALEAILLSFVLADRISNLEQEKEQLRKKQLAILKKNKELIERQNAILEQKVEERTFALTNTNKELNRTLTDLKSAQSKLVEAKKMASLGQLTAGIAHEINNPINFVSSNIKPLIKDMEELITLLNMYEQLEKHPRRQEILKEIARYKKKINKELIVDEIHHLLEGIQEGAQRTTEIITGLKLFSRPEQTGIKKIDINQSIDTALRILKHNLKETTICKKYEKLPLMETYGGKINQVFLNVLNNAIQALNDPKNKNPDPTIEITTKKQGHYLSVQIKDNGIGMNNKDAQQIFEPFFTTKGNGGGTGLGLSISFGIVEAHRGTIEVTSEEGKGSIFTIILPENQS